MKRTSIPSTVAVVALLAAIGGIALAAQDRYALQVPGGLAFSEFRGYENWQTVAVSQSGEKIETILGNPEMIGAYKAGVPGSGKPFPDGAKLAKIHWTANKADDEPGEPLVPGALHDVDFMAKDSKRFADSGGWGYAEFEYDAASDTFRPGNTSDTPPQENDAKCGFACHTIVAAKDYVFTAYPKTVKLRLDGRRSLVIGEFHSEGHSFLVRRACGASACIRRRRSDVMRNVSRLSEGERFQGAPLFRSQPPVPRWGRPPRPRRFERLPQARRSQNALQYPRSIQIWHRELTSV